MISGRSRRRWRSVAGHKRHVSSQHSLWQQHLAPSSGGRAVVPRHDLEAQCEPPKRRLPSSQRTLSKIQAYAHLSGMGAGRPGANVDARHGQPLAAAGHCSWCTSLRDCDVGLQRLLSDRATEQTKPSDCLDQSSKSICVTHRIPSCGSTGVGSAVPNTCYTAEPSKDRLLGKWDVFVMPPLRHRNRQSHPGPGCQPVKATPH